MYLSEKGTWGIFLFYFFKRLQLLLLKTTPAFLNLFCKKVHCQIQESNNNNNKTLSQVYNICFADKERVWQQCGAHIPSKEDLHSDSS